MNRDANLNFQPMNFQNVAVPNKHVGIVLAPVPIKFLYFCVYFFFLTLCSGKKKIDVSFLCLNSY